MTTKIIPPAFITQAEELLDKGYDPKVARGLLRFVKPYTARMFFALILMIIVTASAVSWPYFVKLAIDEGITKNDPVALHAGTTRIRLFRRRPERHQARSAGL